MAIYRIDPAAPKGGDGSESTPYRLLSEAHAVVANGDSILWKRGSRTADYPTDHVFTGFTGLTFGAYPDSSGPKPILDRSTVGTARFIDLSGCDHCTIEDLRFSNGLYGPYLNSCQDATVRRVELPTTVPYYGVYFGASSGVVEDCVFGVNGVSDSGPYYSGVVVTSALAGEGVVVRRCKFYSTGGHTTPAYYKGCVWANNSTTAAAAYIEDCEFHDSDHAAIVMTGAATTNNPKVIATRCLFANSLNASVVSYAKSGTTAGEAIIANSIFVGPDFISAGTVTADILNVAGEAGFKVKVFNNTFLPRRQDSNQIIRWDGTVDTVDVHNNVLMAGDSPVLAYHLVDFDTDATWPSIKSDHNYYNNDHDRFWGHSGLRSFATFQSESGEDANGALAATVLVNATDFSEVITDPLKARNDAESPAIGGGRNLWEAGIITDKRLCTGFRGEPRPSSGAWDAGAFQESTLGDVL